MGRVHASRVQALVFLEKKQQCLNCSYQMNMIFYKNITAPSYPIILCQIMLLLQEQ